MSLRGLRRKIEGLPDAQVIPKRWKVMQAAKEKRHKNTMWKENPLKVVKTPAAIEVFRQLPNKLRHRMFAKLAVERTFSTKKLVTYQPVISSEAVYQFAANRQLARKKKAYIIGTEEGPCIWNGNHRAVAALMCGKKFKAMYLNLVGEK